MSFRSLPRDVMCQKAPSNSSLSGLDMPPRIPRRQENTQKLHRIDRGCFHSEEVLGRFDTPCRVAIRSTRSRGLTLLVRILSYLSSLPLPTDEKQRPDPARPVGGLTLLVTLHRVNTPRRVAIRPRSKGLTLSCPDSSSDEPTATTCPTSACIERSEAGRPAAVVAVADVARGRVDTAAVLVGF